MKRTTLISLLLLCFSVMSFEIYAQSDRSMEAQWKAIDQLLEEQLPESALKQLTTLQSLAEQTNNPQALIKVQLYHYRIQMDKDPTTAPAVLADFERYISNVQPSAEKQLLYSMLAELYYQYYQSNSYVINQRTDLTGALPLTIETWSKQHYQQKITQLLQNAFAAKNLTQQTPLRQVAMLLVQEEQFPSFTPPTLFDFIAQKQITLLQAFDNELSVQSIYKEWIDFRRTQPETELLVLAEVNFFKVLYEQNKQELYLSKLDSLEKVYANSPALVEILFEQASYFQQHGDTTGNLRRAHEISQRGIQAYPTYPRIGLLQNIIHQIETKVIQLKGAEAVKPHSHLKLELETTNISSITLEVYKLNTTATAYQQASLNRGNKAEKLTGDKELRASLTLQIPLNDDFESSKTEYLLNTEDYGIYEYIAYPTGMCAEEGHRVTGYFTVTDFSYIARNLAKDKNAYYVVDRISGERLKDVSITTHQSQWEKDQYVLSTTGHATTNKQGYATIALKSGSRNEIVFFSKGKDQFFTSNVYTTYYRQRTNRSPQQEQISLFTDRALYRPGQSVHYKAIAYQSSRDNETVIANKTLQVALIDANGQTISEQQVTTNSFGSAAGAFIIPTGGLNGSYQITANGQFRESFLVEAYKRPSFEVVLTQPAEELSFGTPVSIRGEVKAYAAYALPNTKVSYTINRYVHPYWRWFPIRNEKTIASGETTTDAEGNFTIDFTPELDHSITDKLQQQAYQYKIEVDATDQKGESQQGISYFSVSQQSLFIVAEVPAMIDKQAGQPLKVTTETILGKTIPQEISYTLSTLKATDDYAENLPADYEHTPLRVVQEGRFNTKNKALTIDFTTLSSGRYSIEFTAKDKKGSEVKTTHIFVLFDQRDKRPPVKTYAWLPTASMQSVLGEKVTVRFGTSVPQAHVLFEVMQGNEVISSKWIKMNNTIRSFAVPFTDKYKEGISVHFTFIRDEQLIHKRVTITEKHKVKKLTPTLTVFRDKLLPGEQATWTLQIPELAVNPQAAELLLGMYDASLDAIQPHPWHFNPTFTRSIPYTAPWRTTSNQQWINPAYITQQPIEVPGFYTPAINWFGLNIAQQRHSILIRGYGSAKMSSSNVKEVAFGSVAEEGLTSDAELSEVQLQVAPALPPTPIQQQVRTNFNETAFFYPQVYGDSLGNYNFSFTMPESLTRWNLKMLAHTKNLYYGQSEATVVTQQDLMVQLNMPRFVRQSDTIILSATVVNLSDIELNTEVRLSFIDPITNTTLLLSDTNAVQLSLAAGASKSLIWETKGFESHELLICKIVARAGNFSDGEQQYLAVLPDKILVTESYPISIRGGQTKEYRFDKIHQLANEVATQQLTFEFSSNPIWYAIQALPALAAPANENAICNYVAWYVNTIASNILTEHPNIQHVFEQLQHTGDKNALQSALEKNQDLKNILLEATPWLMEAKNDTEQLQRIALLFELNQQRQQRTLYLDQLQQLQLPNGAFEWFQGMGENRWVTQFIAGGLIKSKAISSDQVLTEMINKAVEYLDGQLAKDFHDLKQRVKDYDKRMTITPLQLQYLTMRTSYQAIEVTAATQLAMDYYLQQTETYRTKFALNEKAMAALILYQSNNKTAAEAVIKSLKENAIKSESAGMYWANNKAGYFWNERPISIHTRLMEAFATIAGNSSDMDEMKVWLLQQKQTQQWDSPISTVEAINALLNYGDDWSTQGEQYTLKVGNKTLDTSKGVPGTGYIKQSLSIDDVKNGITISTNNQSHSAPAWGSLYWQYYQNMDKVSASGSSLKVDKQLFIEQMMNNKRILQPLHPQGIPSKLQQVNKGDKLVVRMVVTTDRNLEFVALKDNRAANLEPINQLSGSQWKENTLYYRTTTDASTQYFFNYLAKGTYVFEDAYYVNASGSFSGGTATIQCLYAPEFIGTSAGERVEVK